jgi:hypothetical protein
MPLTPRFATENVITEELLQVRPVFNKQNILTSLRPVMALALVSAGLGQAIAPVLAQTMTAAGTDISNTATASYEDPSVSGESINTVSNTVSVKVAEVAGIALTNVGVSKLDANGANQTGATIVAGDDVGFEYKITNTGNDATGFRIPSAATLNVNLETTYNVQYKVGSTWTDVPTGGITLNTTDGQAVNVTGSNLIKPGDHIIVRIKAKVTTGGTGSIEAKLGNATPNNGTGVTRVTNGDDLYTEDNADGTTGEVVGAPNNILEASISQSTTIGATPKAFVKIEKTSGGVVEATPPTPTTVKDDSITYTLKLDVSGSVPASYPTGTGNFLAADLAGTDISVDGTTAKRILVSDAIPAGTKLALTQEANSVPANWTTVYMREAGNTVAGNANNASWSTTAPTTQADANTVTRVGFVSGVGATVAKNTTVNDFKIKVLLTDVSDASPSPVLNIAQVFGSTSSQTDLVGDESGDQDYSNNGDILGDGVVTGATGEDPGNNTGTGSSGEANKTTVSAPEGTLLNGPENAATAVGDNTTNGSNTDFTVKTTKVPTTALTNGVNSTFDPAEQSFNNTVRNTSSSTQKITLLPSVGTVTHPVMLPVGSTITIEYNDNTIAVPLSVATYTWNGTIFQLQGTSTGMNLNNGHIAFNVNAGADATYKVKVDLATTDVVKKHQVPIVAFIDKTTGGNAGVADASEPQNVTINKLYTGYIKLEKEARILKSDGTTPVGTGDFSPNPGKAEPGQFIEYKIKYSNIADSITGATGSKTVLPSNIKIEENGATAPNTWAASTEHKTGSASSTTGTATIDMWKANGVITTTADTEISRYRVNVPSLPAQTDGTFTFIRKVK